MRTLKIAAVLFGIVWILGCQQDQGRTCCGCAARHENTLSAGEKEIAALFDKWNLALGTGDPEKVAALYAGRSILLPTLSSKPRLTTGEKEEYFTHFLEKKPSATIDMREITLGKDMAVDSGIYIFTFAETGQTVKARYSFIYRKEGGKWLIASHHSSLQPEEK